MTRFRRPATRRAAPSAIRSSKASSSGPRRSWGSERSSAASTSPTTSGSSGSRATEPPARSASASPARPTGTSLPKSTKRGSGSRSWGGIPRSAFPAEYGKYPVPPRLALTGRLVVARDLAHAKLKERLDAGSGLPQYFKDHPVYYAGPAKTPKGKPSGSFGPTTAGRMDSYVDLFQSQRGSLIMIAKGNRSPKVTEACKKHGGFYLGSPGGPAALLAEENIKKVDVLEYPELGMEAIWAIDVVDFPAFVLVDDKGNDFYQQLK